MKHKFKKAFSLAELLIAIVIISILAAVVIPAAHRSKPDENVLKFMKHNEILASAITDLVTSGDYYMSGDLGRKPDGTQITNDSDVNKKYFCASLSGFLSTKRIDCKTTSYATSYVDFRKAYGGEYGYTMSDGKNMLDSICTAAQGQVGAEIITTDNVSYFQASPSDTFGVAWGGTGRLFSDPNNVTHKDPHGFDQIYKVMCIDIDGINKGEAPFGYGIRADGKIVLGTKADVWVDKKVTITQAGGVDDEAAAASITSGVCIAGYKRSGGNCVDCGVANCLSYSSGCSCNSCSAGFAPSGGVCIDCNVAHCTGYSGGCTCASCEPGYYVSDGKCVACGVSQCTGYSSGCTCSSCNTGYKVSGGSCTACGISQCSGYSSGCSCSSCNGGYCLNTSNNTCTQRTNCTSCNNTNGQCNACSTSYKVSNGACVACGVSQCTGYSSGCTCSSCNAGYKVSNGSCVACGVSQCTGYSSGCTCSSCNAGYKVSNGSCVSCGVSQCTGYSSGCTCSSCNAGYYVSGGSCASCGVSKCTGYSSGCTCSSCSQWYKASGGSCVFDCSGTYMYQIGSLCILKFNVGDNGIPLTGVSTWSTSNGQASNAANGISLCWVGQTTNSCGGSDGSGYGGCYRTMCNWWGAHSACENLVFAEMSDWRLPYDSELALMTPTSTSRGQGGNGLMLCTSDATNTYSMTGCASTTFCHGAGSNICFPASLWSLSCYHSDCSSRGNYAAYQNSWDLNAWHSQESIGGNAARSVRCVRNL